MSQVDNFTLSFWITNVTCVHIMSLGFHTMFVIFPLNKTGYSLIKIIVIVIVIAIIVILTTCKQLLSCLNTDNMINMIFKQLFYIKSYYIKLKYYINYQLCFQSLPLSEKMEAGSSKCPNHGLIFLVTTSI